MPASMTEADSLRVVGLMSGTSVDAIDAALVRVTGSGASLSATLEAFHTEPVPPRLRERVLRACRPGEADTALLAELNVELGEAFARAAFGVLDGAGISPDDIDLIGSHGQTVFHRGATGPDGVACTLQLGEPSVIAEHTGITTIADFRPRDLAAGGQGAPLVSYVDWALYRDPHAGRALQNIGGIANVTVLPAGATPDAVLAFDTGPGNMLIDAVASLATGGVQTFDEDGRLARAGRPDAALLQEILDHPFFQLTPPRTAGREQFGEPFAHRHWERGLAVGLRPEDVVATCTLATACSIADAYRRFILPTTPLSTVYVSGGSARNPALMEWLRQEVPDLDIRPFEEIGGDAKAKEAFAFAILAAETVRGVPTSLQRVTGASHSSVLGKIVPGANWAKLQERLRKQQSVPQQESTAPVGLGHPSAPPAESTITPLVPASSTYATGSLIAIGLDGGGTKTEAVALDQDGKVVARAQGGPANPYAAGFDVARASLRATLIELTHSLPPGRQIVGVHAALAGVGRPEDQPPALAMLAELSAEPELASVLGVVAPDRLSVSNDALAVLAAAGATEGIVVIAGTGSIVWGRDTSGRTARAGGWGYLLGDEGSGYDLGRRALGALLQAFDGRGPATALTAPVLRHLGVESPPGLVRRLYGAAQAREDIASVAPLVLQAREAGDAVAVSLVAQSVADLSDLVRVVAHRLVLGPAAFTIACAGGLFRWPPLVSQLQAALAGCSGARCQRAERSPAEGAALLAWWRAQPRLR